MEKLLGVLFCGGRGVRLGEITQFISKSFVPIYDKPVFRYGLDLLEKSEFIDEIVILTNPENDEKLKGTGYPTIIQDDARVNDMFSGWQFVRNKLKTKKHGVLMPSDNLSDAAPDRLITAFLENDAKTAFSLYEVPDKTKLAQMGVYDPETKSYFYKHPSPPTSLGVIAPFIVHNSLTTVSGEDIIGHPNAVCPRHKGFWFDVGDVDSLIEASAFVREK